MKTRTKWVATQRALPPRAALTFNPSMLDSRKLAGLFLGPLLFTVVILFYTPEGLSPSARAILASTIWVSTWWISEAVPIPVASLLPLILFPLSGGLSLDSTSRAYGDPMVFLFVGAFILAIATERCGLHKRIALNIIQRVGSSCTRIVLGFMVATAALSMWISNTATSMMMVPMGMAIVTVFNELISQRQEDQDDAACFGKALMLGIAYSASIGGLATLIGTPTNLVFSGVVRSLYGYDVTFLQWLALGLPFCLILLGVCWAYLVYAAFPLSRKQIPGGPSTLERELAALGRISQEEMRVFVVFACTAIAWTTRTLLLNRFVPELNDTAIAIMGATALFIIPSSSGARSRLLDWETAAKLPWGIVLLFGGGLSLAAGFRESGLAIWLGEQLTLLNGVPHVLLLGLVIAGVNLLTEVTSNVASASILLPVLASMPLATGASPFALMLSACLASSCAFMLPVATPPNAVAFSSGCLSIGDMVRIGFAMNVLSIALLTIYVQFALPCFLRVFDFNLPQTLM